MKRRRKIHTKTKLAAALCQMMMPDENGKFVRIIEHEDAKKLSADQIISIFQFHHHPIAKALGGPDEHWNLEPKPILEHRYITAKETRPAIGRRPIRASKNGPHLQGDRIGQDREGYDALCDLRGRGQYGMGSAKT
jgi:hypothetical protein